MGLYSYIGWVVRIQLILCTYSSFLCKNIEISQKLFKIYAIKYGQLQLKCVVLIV